MSMARSSGTLAQVSLCREVQDLWVESPVPLAPVSELDCKVSTLLHRLVI